MLQSIDPEKLCNKVVSWGDVHITTEWGNRMYFISGVRAGDYGNMSKLIKGKWSRRVKNETTGKGDHLG